MINFKDDISYEIAYRAFYNVSFDPEKRAEQTREDYAQELQAIQAQLAEANVPDYEFDRFHQSYKRRYIDWLSSKSRCMSSMITGPANFPVRRARKANDAEHNKLSALLEFKSRVIKKIIRKYNPDTNTIRSDDNDAIAKLEKKISRLQDRHDFMKKVNAGFRIVQKTGCESALNSLGFSHDQIVELCAQVEKAYSWEKQPFPKYMLSNSSANIRRLRDRLISLQREQQAPAQDIQRGDIRVVEDKDSQRLQLFFPKERTDIRQAVKKRGFRWTPSRGCWQRLLNNNARYAAENILSLAAQE